MKSYEELFAIAKTLNQVSHPDNWDQIEKPLKAFERAANEVGRSFSGSWLGYHAYVYYNNFAVPRPGNHFSQEVGLYDPYGPSDGWKEYSREDVKAYIEQKADRPNIEIAEEAAERAAAVFNKAKDNILSIIGIELLKKADPFLKDLMDNLSGLEPSTPIDIVDSWSPKGQIVTSDTIALSQKLWVPPHIEILARTVSIQHSFNICRKAAEIAIKAASHLERKSEEEGVAERIGTNVFIGHGRSLAWRELKDFIQDRLHLPWDEFNRVPIAGITNITRLSQMLDSAAIAFLIMTAEDELGEGAIQPRMNVVHEAGLFQGRLGFSRAIVLLEEGCKPFTNIEGLGQIRFAQNNISGCFEEVRRVLEREKLIDAI